jgi:hypothetical protein
MKRLCPWVVVCTLVAACGDDGTWSAPPANPGEEADAEAEAWPEADLPGTGSYDPPKVMYAHSGSELFRIDPTTLEVTLVGSFNPNAPHMTDLAVTPDGQVYALSNNNLYRVDPQTAKVTWVAQVPGTLNVAMTFDIDGSLLAADKEGGFKRVDPTTGQITEVGSYGSGLGSSGDLVALADGSLYDVNDVGTAKSNNTLVKVDPATGAAVTVGAIGFRMVWGLSFWGGTLYGFTRSGEFIAIEPATGEGTLIHTFPNEFWGAAVTPKAPLTLY